MIIIFIWSILCLVVLLPVAVYAVEIAVAPSGSTDIPASEYSIAPNFTVVVPAHNEALTIATALRAIQHDLREGDRLVVVADNCTDETAAISASAGAEVLIRHDLMKKGKGYALQFGLDSLQSRAPDVVIFIDADCVPEQFALQKLAYAASNLMRPIQAQYLFEQPLLQSRSQRVSAFALRIKNDVRLSGDASLGIPSIITGSGIALPWALASRIDLGNSNIVEDMALGIDLVSQGINPVYLRSAMVRTLLPTDLSSQKTQRTRWEHGHITIIPYAIAKLIPVAIQSRSWPPLGYAFAIMVPPISLLAMICTSFFLISVCAFYFGFLGIVSVILAGIVFGVLVLAVLIAWWKTGRDLITGGDLFRIPLYIIAKLPVYLLLVFGKRIGWVRTRRTGE
ncbi:glycosyltransferase family 2 protein [Rhizobium rhododendri]|uniref:Glycosyltransferase family 2 protein n=1 Tax=Rhizobium rhododendri TaxID=2506430 RepID=A0ABY8INB4_9HYPH|nr:glycosyltransferase family 2 protein [Rhizobium rhododendri]WFS25216.1 glycosyltransferase family 2 protein [Rhizobium rhododendri]